MAKASPALALSRLNGGVNSFVDQALPNQCEEALDVISDAGQVRRRDAFKAIGTGAPFVLPAGKTSVVIFTNATLSYTTLTNRTTNFTPAIFGSTGNVYIGCSEPFDGIDWKHVSEAPASPTANARLTPQYWNGTAWVTLTCVDTTRARALNGSNIWFQSLCQDGTISWHRSQATGWATLSLNSITKYWIRLTIDRGSLSGTGNLILVAPGPRAFILEPIQSLLPFRSKEGVSSVIVASDRRKLRGSELGAQLGIWKGIMSPTKIAHQLYDEGSGVYGQVTWQQSFRSDLSGTSIARGWPSGTNWTANGGGGTYGTTGATLTKNNRGSTAVPYEWINDASDLQDEHRGSVVYTNLAPVGSISNTAPTPTFAITVSNLAVNKWEGMRLRCTAKGAGGVPLNEEVEVISNTAGTIQYYPPFSIAPDTDNRFVVTRPHMVVRFRQTPRESEVTATTGSHTLTVAGASQPWSAAPGISNKFVHWEIGRELQWSVPAADFWTGCFDVTTRVLILTNGPSGLMQYDGKSLRRLEAHAEGNSERMRTWVSNLPDSARELLASKNLAGSTVYKTPPSGQFVTDFHGRLVVANGYYINWSAPAPDNDIWPLVYETQVRDAENNKINGLATLNNELVAWTVSSIFAAGPPDENGLFYMQPRAQGVGFVSHRAVEKISFGGQSALIGPSADGIIRYNGSQPVTMLDDWRRVLPGGVNPRLMSRCVGAASKFTNRYYLAVPSAGSNVNDRIIVGQSEPDGTMTWWAWTAPWGGISEITRDYDEHGQEQILFGTNDGHIAILVSADTDDGSTITGYARSIPVSPLGARTVAPTGVMVSAHETGSSQTLTVKSFVNERDNAVQTFSSPFNAGTSLWGASVWGASTASNVMLWGSKPIVTRKINIPAGTKCNQYQFEVRGTGRWSFDSAELLLAQKGYRSK